MGTLPVFVINPDATPVPLGCLFVCFFSFTDTDLGKEAKEAVLALEQQLRSEPNFPQALHNLTEPCGATVRMACVVQGNETRIHNLKELQA